MRQFISTQYVGPSNVRGSRVKVTTSSGISLSWEWDDALNTDENHTAAAKLLATKLGWSGQWVAGAANNGCVFVWSDGDGFTVTKTV